MRREDFPAHTFQAWALAARSKLMYVLNQTVKYAKNITISSSPCSFSKD
jgi:hypothetical protein